MPRELVTIEVKVKGVSHAADCPRWSTGLPGNPQADELEVLAEAIEQGLIAPGHVFKRMNYAEDLKTRAAVTQRQTPKKGKISDASLNEIAAIWGKTSPTTFTLAVTEKRQQEALLRFYQQIIRMNDDQAPNCERITSLFPKCLETIEAPA